MIQQFVSNPSKVERACKGVLLIAHPLKVCLVNDLTLLEYCKHSKIVDSWLSLCVVPSPLAVPLPGTNFMLADHSAGQRCNLQQHQTIVAICRGHVIDGFCG